MSKNHQTDERKSLDKAISLLGGVSRMAVELKVKPSAIANWRMRGWVPYDQCVKIELATCGKVKRVELRPDIFAAFRKLRQIHANQNLEADHAL